MKISNEIKKRYVQRIKELKYDDDKELQRYLVANNEIIEKDIIKMFENSTLFFEGKIGDKQHKFSKYYIRDNIILVVSRCGNDLVTLYRVSFGIENIDEDGTINRSIIKRLLDKLDKLNSEKQEVEKNIEENKNILETEINNLKLEINNLSEQLMIKSDQLKIKQSDLKNTALPLASIEKEIESIVIQLITKSE